MSLFARLLNELFSWTRPTIALRGHWFKPEIGKLEDTSTRRGGSPVHAGQAAGVEGPVSGPGTWEIGKTQTVNRPVPFSSLYCKHAATSMDSCVARQASLFDCGFRPYLGTDFMPRTRDSLR